MEEAVDWSSFPVSTPCSPWTSHSLQKRLSAEQKKALATLAHFASEPQRFASEGYALVASIPLHVQFVLPHVVQWHISFLSVQDRFQEAWELQLQQLEAYAKEPVDSVLQWWLRYGIQLIELLNAMEEHSEEAAVHKWLCEHYEPWIEQKTDVWNAPRTLVQSWISKHVYGSIQNESAQQLGRALSDPIWQNNPKQMVEWSDVWVDGFKLCLQDFNEYEEEARLLVVRACLALPWERFARRLDATSIHTLFRELRAAGQDACFERLFQRIETSIQNQAIVAFWKCQRALYIHHSIEDVQIQLTAIRTHLFEDGFVFTDADWLWMAQTSLRFEWYIDTEFFLTCVVDKDASAFLSTAIVFCSAIQEFEQASACVDRLRIQEDEPGWVAVFSIGLAVQKEEWDRVEEWLDAFQEDAASMGVWSPHICILQDVLFAQTGQWGRVVHAFHTHWERFQSAPSHPWFSPQILCSILDSFAEAFEALEEDQDALNCTLQVLRMLPLERAFHRATRLLFKHQQWSDAEILLQQAHQAFPHSTPLLYALFVVSEKFERWEHCQRLLDTIGRDWFELHGSVDAWIVGQARLKIVQGRALDALAFCETELPYILQDEDLSAFRTALFDDVYAQYSSYMQDVQQDIEAREVHSSALQKVQTSTESIPALNYGVHAAEMVGNAPRLHQDEHSDMWRHKVHEELETLTSFFPKGAALSKESYAFLNSALMLWHQYSAFSELDHSPIVLQLARTLEGELNRCVIHPLIVCAHRQGISLSALPSSSFRALSMSDNHLSLGHIARMLYHRIRVVEDDGSFSVRINPSSSSQHAECLKIFWNELLERAPSLRSTWMDTLPLDIEWLAKIRNRAGHARSIVSRTEAKDVYTRVLGESGTGLLISVMEVGHYATQLIT